MKSLIKFFKHLLGMNTPAPTVRHVHAPTTPVESEKPGDKFLRKAQVATRRALENTPEQLALAAGIYGGEASLEEVDEYLSRFTTQEFRQLSEEYQTRDDGVTMELTFDVREGNLTEKQSFIVMRTGGMPIPKTIFDDVAREAEEAFLKSLRVPSEPAAPTVPVTGAVPREGEPVLIPVEPTKVDELDDDAPEISPEDAQVIDTVQPEPTLAIAEQVSFAEPEPVLDPALKAEAERYMSDKRYTLVKHLAQVDDVLYVRPATSDTLQWIPAVYFPKGLVRGLETLEHYEERVRVRKAGKKRLGARERKRLAQAK